MVKELEEKEVKVHTSGTKDSCCPLCLHTSDPLPCVNLPFLAKLLQTREATNRSFEDHMASTLESTCCSSSKAQNMEGPATHRRLYTSPRP